MGRTLEQGAILRWTLHSLVLFPSGHLLIYSVGNIAVNKLTAYNSSTCNEGDKYLRQRLLKLPELRGCEPTNYGISKNKVIHQSVCNCPLRHLSIQTGTYTTTKRLKHPLRIYISVVPSDREINIVKTTKKRNIFPIFLVEILKDIYPIISENQFTYIVLTQYCLFPLTGSNFILNSWLKENLMFMKKDSSIIWIIW